VKTKTLFLICLFLAFAMTKLSAQDFEKNHSYSVKTEVINSFPLYCNGVMIETLSGSMDAHRIDHFKNGVWEFQIAQYNGEAISKAGEIFRLSEVDKQYIPLERVETGHGNLIGNNGIHLIVFFTSRDWWHTITIDKAVCIENANE
jgi:hypothetical protein